MVIGGKQRFQYKCKIEYTYIFSKDKVVLLGVIIDNKLTFEAYIENLCKKASYKLSALQRIRKLLTVMQAKALASSFVNSQFKYCALVQMFCSRKAKLRLENIHKRTLKQFTMNTRKPTRIILRIMMKLVFVRNIYSFWQLKSSNW